MKKNETRIVCPNCGTEFKIAEQTHVSVGVVIGKDSNLGTIYPEAVKKGKLPKKAADRIEALKEAGVDVSNLFAMTGSNGGEYVVSQKDGKLSFLEDDDPIFKAILEQGSIPNRKLFRRWVMAQMFHMLAREQQYGRWYQSITDQIRRMGVDYMWKQTIDEFYAQSKMYDHNDRSNLNDRVLWFNKNLVVTMIEDYMKQLENHIKTLKVKHCNGVPYKKICGENVFLTDIDKKVYNPILSVLTDLQTAYTPHKIWCALLKFKQIRKTTCWKPVQCKEWIDAYKGAGAFYTMQNMIRFHKCKMHDRGIVYANKDESYHILESKAIAYQGEGWRMIGLLRKFLKDNNIDINKKMSEWRK